MTFFLGRSLQYGTGQPSTLSVTDSIEWLSNEVNRVVRDLESLQALPFTCQAAFHFFLCFASFLGKKNVRWWDMVDNEVGHAAKKKKITSSSTSHRFWNTLIKMIRPVEQYSYSVHLWRLSQKSRGFREKSRRWHVDMLPSVKIVAKSLIHGFFVARRQHRFLVPLFFLSRWKSKEEKGRVEEQ